MLKLGLFMMPLHMPGRNIAEALAEDQDLVVLADQLGFEEAWMGEHLASTAEPVTSPAIFNASVLSRAPNIRLGSGVMSLPNQHPVVVAGHVALLDQLSGGRVIMGIGSGGLCSDWEILDNLDHGKRGRAMLESIDVILRLWTEGPPFHHTGESWQFSMADHVIDALGIGHWIKPLQHPHPPVAVSIRGAQSGLAVLAGERDWIPISGNFISAADIACHWPRYRQGAATAGRTADPAIWRVGRSVLVTESAAQAEDMLADPHGVFADYYYYLTSHMKLAMGQLPEPFDPAVERAEAVIKARDLVIAGTRDQVLDQLIGFREQVGDFGHLIITGHDMAGNISLWQNSFRAVAKDIAPRISQHMDVLRAQGCDHQAVSAS